MICLCPQRSWKRGHGTEGVWRCGSGKNQKSPSWASSRSYPAIPSPTFNISVYISACEPFEYVCILNLPRLCFSSLLKGHGGRGWSGNSRIRRMNTTLLIGYLCSALNPEGETRHCVNDWVSLRLDRIREDSNVECGASWRVLGLIKNRCWFKEKVMIWST